MKEIEKNRGKYSGAFKKMLGSWRIKPKTIGRIGEEERWGILPSVGLHISGGQHCAATDCRGRSGWEGNTGGSG